MRDYTDTRMPHEADYYKTDWTPIWCMVGVATFFVILIYIFG